MLAYVQNTDMWGLVSLFFISIARAMEGGCSEAMMRT